MSTDRQETQKHTDLVLEVTPPEVGHLKMFMKRTPSRLSVGKEPEKKRKLIMQE